MSETNIFYNNIGVVERISDGIINILGLQNATNGEMVETFTIFKNNINAKI
jgi:F0F1-type ATP synthase alpha subunit